MRRLFFIFLFFCLIFTGLIGIHSAEGQGPEKILSFNSRIEVHPDSTLGVRETIKVYSVGINIKRGIYRDFPTRYIDRYGNEHNVGLEVLEVLRDGKPERFRSELRYNGVRIYIGDPNYYLPKGEYTYTFEYLTTRQLGFFPDHDELYWNVTGNGWDFSIESAQATVVLPEGARLNILGKKGYTGYQGSREEAVFITGDIFGNTVFETTRLLRSREGFTIAVSWPKGYVREPTFITRMGYFLSDNRAILFSLLGLFIVLGYYLVTWHYAGRDPKKGTIISLFHPPKDLNPALVRYIKKMGYDTRVFTAAVLNMAVKGFLQIEEKDAGFLKFGKTYIISKTGKNTSSLSAEESAIAGSLLGARSEIELNNKNHLIFEEAIRGLRSALQKEAGSFYFLKNSIFFGLGLAITGLFLTTLIFGLFKSGGSVFLILFINVLMVTTFNQQVQR